jgi:hypothetical protein
LIPIKALAADLGSPELRRELQEDIQLCDGRVAIIQGNPDPGRNRVRYGLADAYLEAATAGEHEVIRVEVARLDFPILRTQQDFEHGRLPETLVEAQNAIVSAEHLAIFFSMAMARDGTGPCPLS